MIYYAHTGGYTELGGIKEFLTKINNIDYKLLVPARKKLPKPKIKNVDSGLTGKAFFDRIKERASFHRDIEVLIIIDDGDCKVSNGIINESINNLKKELKQIKLIFLFAEPEIEKWFCLDKSCISNRSCNNKSLHSILNELIQNINYEYDKNKKSCKEKFSNKFKKILEECGLNYYKNSNGSEYLKKIDPNIIYKKDKLARNAISAIRNLKYV